MCTGCGDGTGVSVLGVLTVHRCECVQGVVTVNRCKCTGVVTVNRCEGLYCVE